jgi:hypothetical protein
MSVLELVSGVSADYRHITKVIRPAPSLALDDTVLKWYDIAPAEAPVPREVRELARSGLREESEWGTLELSRHLGFVILHRCGHGFYFLIVATWRNDNELWESVWAKDGDADPTFRPWPLGASPRPTFCVWELGAVWHEQQAWTRFLRSERDEAAKQAYLRDSYEGPV